MIDLASLSNELVNTYWTITEQRLILVGIILGGIVGLILAGLIIWGIILGILCVIDWIREKIRSKMVQENEKLPVIENENIEDVDDEKDRYHF